MEILDVYFHCEIIEYYPYQFFFGRYATYHVKFLKHVTKIIFFQVVPIFSMWVLDQ